jgi:AcrR family transcriptional regulator
LSTHRPDDPLPLSALLKTPRQPRSSEMVHNILDAGMKVIEDSGLHSMSTNRVAECAGVSIGSLYQYFANRDSILAGIIERSLLDIVHRLRAEQRFQHDIPPEAFIGGGLRMMLRYYDPHQSVVRAIFREAPLLADNSVVHIMETNLMDISRDYALANADRYLLRGGLPALYVAVNSLIFLYLKWLVAPHPLLTEDEFIDAVIGQVTAVFQPRTEDPATDKPD